MCTSQDVASVHNKDLILVFFFKQKTAYEMRISDWSSDVCSSDLVRHAQLFRREGDLDAAVGDDLIRHVLTIDSAKLRAGLDDGQEPNAVARHIGKGARNHLRPPYPRKFVQDDRSEEHTSELQSLMRISYAAFCLKTITIPAVTNSLQAEV